MQYRYKQVKQKGSIGYRILGNELKNKRLVVWLILLTLARGTLAFCSGTDDWLTDYEKSGCLETPRYAETMAYCHRLEQASPWVKVTDFGLSAQGRKLPLIIIDKDSNFTPDRQKDSQKAVVLIQSCIHPGESDGKDAGLMLVRDIVIHRKFPHLLDNVTILFIPIFNVDGHERFGPYNRINQSGPKEMGWRVTAQNLDLNRDFLKADAPEMRAWLKLFNAWLPDLLVDCHVTNGADYRYVMTYGLETHQNITEPIRRWTTKVFLPYLEENMIKSGFPIIPYVIPKVRHDITKGLIGLAWRPRYSTGYGVVQNRPFLLIETHMLKDYRTRVNATYEILRHLLQLAVSESRSLRRAVREGDRLTAETLTGSDFPLDFELTGDSTMINFQGVDFHVEHSDISGTEWIRYGHTPMNFKMPFFNSVRASETATLPYAYLVPPQWQEVIDILQLHGVVIQRLKEPITLIVDSYRFLNPSWQARPCEGRHYVRFEVAPINEERNYSTGTAVIMMNQRTNRVIAHILEPKGPDSFVAWGFFDAIFERKEYAEDYVLETMAREMLTKDEKLKNEFEAKLAADSSFAANPHERLYFFYKRSPYWDKNVNVYPIGKLMRETELPIE